ncbi:MULTISPECIES: type II toxin-antitoxin system VapC family toxin [Bifidobacterium]|jgi:predicted nucleic acid-binding protein|uniref:PIN domain-containing protein n=1 Tax=Bifidobacterium tibiigranuli TaxID=2172043 RepID=A0A5N6S1Q8_9BIFI|nr:PIN domain-containing protein [Bifidobacterium tibiigranuli]KAE8127074.1 PIN domain-containing protein [Bifidobacterium tibiigranuli]KAE8127729.1 PIN domain-containing protein [Bifidobacterium tibiigranuli]MCI1211563.1 PIN domain-containing protein [Bifidobacterium tibiigranuli]
MPKVYLDTNILLDAASEQRPGHRAAALLLESSAVELGISAGSLKDFYYIATGAKSAMNPKTGAGLDDGTCREYIRLFLNCAELLPDDRRVCSIALDSNEPDYEDGTKRAAAEVWGADCIVSRDNHRHAFRNSSIPRIDAERFLEELGPTFFRSSV